jgi:hypothetical protein
VSMSGAALVAPPRARNRFGRTLHRFARVLDESNRGGERGGAGLERRARTGRPASPAPEGSGSSRKRSGRLHEGENRSRKRGGRLHQGRDRCRKRGNLHREQPGRLPFRVGRGRERSGATRSRTVSTRQTRRFDRQDAKDARVEKGQIPEVFHLAPPASWRFSPLPCLF